MLIIIGGLATDINYFNNLIKKLNTTNVTYINLSEEDLSIQLNNICNYISKFEKINLIGFSSGAIMAILIKSICSYKINKLILINPSNIYYMIYNSKFNYDIHYSCYPLVNNVYSFDLIFYFMLFLNFLKFLRLNFMLRYIYKLISPNAPNIIVENVINKNFYKLYKFLKQLFFEINIFTFLKKIDYIHIIHGSSDDYNHFTMLLSEINNVKLHCVNGNHHIIYDEYDIVANKILSII